MIDFVANIEYVNRKQEIIKKAISALRDLEDYKLINTSENLAEINTAINSLENIDTALDNLEARLTSLLYEEADLIADCY